MKTRQTTLRLPEDLADKAEVVARASGKSLNQFILDSLAVEIDRIRHDSKFMETLERLLERDREILKSLGE